MEAHNWKERRPRRAIAACIALGLALAAVLVVLHSTLPGPQGLAGDIGFRAIPGHDPPPGGGWLPEPSRDGGIPAASLATLTPTNDKDKLCEWKYELVDAKDANGDGHPDYVHVRGLCIYEKDANADGNPEISLKMARDFEAWDNDSNGVFNVLTGKQGLMAFADPNSNGKHEVEAKELWNLEMMDEIEAQDPEPFRVA